MPPIRAFSPTLGGFRREGYLVLRELEHTTI
jgi:hypothetical protein